MTAAFAAITAFFLWQSMALSRSASLIPLFVFSLTLLLLIVQLTLEHRQLRKALSEQRTVEEQAGTNHAGRSQAESGEGRRPAWKVWLWMILLPICFGLFGVIAGATVFCLFFVALRSGESATFSLVFSSCLGLAMYLVFTVLLQTQLYQGLLNLPF